MNEVMYLSKALVFPIGKETMINLSIIRKVIYSIYLKIFHPCTVEKKFTTQIEPGKILVLMYFSLVSPNWNDG